MINSFSQNTCRLIQLAQDGNQSAVEDLFRKFGPKALQIARLRMGKQIRQRMESMDIVNEAFLSAWSSLGNFTYKNDGDFLRWLSQIIENRIRDNIQKISAEKRDPRREIPLNISDTCKSMFISNEPVDETTPSLLIRKKEDLQRLEMAIDKLKPEYREILIISLTGLSVEDIASSLGKSAGAVHMLLKRAKVKLSEYFEESKW